MEAKFLPMDEQLLSVEKLRRLVSEAAFAAEERFRVGRVDISDKLRAELLCRLKQHLNDYVLIRVRGELAGFYCFYRSGNTMLIHDLYIIPEYRCRGLGTKAIKRCISSTELPICVSIYNADRFARSLFANNGFRAVKELDTSVAQWIYDNCEPF